jgi:hypothetical protein
MAVIKELFAAYSAGELPTEGGLIVTSYFDDETTYSKYEVTSYNNVKDIYVSDEGLVFQADGYKLFVLVEPASYPKKHIEPAYRDGSHKIPYRAKEVNIYTSKRQDKIMIGKEPVITYTSFTILKPTGVNFSYIVYKDEDLMETMERFFSKTIWEDARVPKRDAEEVSKLIVQSLDKVVNPAFREE